MTNQSNTTNGAEKADIIIDLSQPDSPKAGSMLQIAANKSLLTFLKERKERLKDKESESSVIYHTRFHQTVLIEGGRGSGKTNFLIRFLDDYSKPDNGSSNASDKPKVCILPIIDPTLIESKDHILLMIIDLIDKSIEKFQDNEHTSDSEDYAYNDAREKLAEGLVLLDGIGSKDVFGQEWEDASWAMSEGLRKASKRRNFELKLNNYIETALKILKCEFFILSFDDVDTNFERGYMILEALRKYLTSPQLFVILSGDIELYGRLIRKNIYENFGTDVMKFEGESKNDISKERLQDAVNELEEQYLLKILPPQYRIPMLPLGTIKQDIFIQAIAGVNAPKFIMRSWALKNISIQLHEVDADDNKFLDIIFAEPIRLVLGYLRALQLTDITESRRRVLQLFNLRLRAIGIPQLQLQPESFDTTLSVILSWFINVGEPAALIKFSTNQISKTVVPLHCLSLALADGLNSAPSILRALFALALPAVMTKQNFLENSDKRKKFLNYLWQGGNPEIADFTARIGAVSRFQDQRGALRPTRLGAIGLANFWKTNDAIKILYRGTLSNPIKAEEVDDTKQKTFGWDVENINRKWLKKIHSKNDDLSPYRNIIWYRFQDLFEEDRLYNFDILLKTISYKYYNSSGEEQNALSTLSLFSTIGILCDLDRGMEAAFSKATVEDILPFFSVGAEGNNIGIQTNLVDKSAVEDINKAALKVENIDDLDNPFSSFYDYAQDIKKWRYFAAKLSSVTKLSPSMLGDLATRLHDDLVGLDDAVRSGGDVMTGQIVHRQIINILNSVIAVTGNIPGRRQSPKASDKVVFTTLKGLKKTGSVGLYPLAFILLSCPLIWAFLQPDKTLANEDNTPYDENETFREAVYEILVENIIKMKELIVGEEERKEFEGLFAENIDVWMTPPKIHVKIGRIAKDEKNQRYVTIDGFFDLLNIVPHYTVDDK
ncbi:hypothetical protein [Bartonella sp. HY038]|uniref:hypothetical protein n=1 Tax=Bartonella sp. HY038 TaxID=2759660 RepID=UPI0015FDED30|nr:hypothetical protein [Bartonella sp. HY038]